MQKVHFSRAMLFGTFSIVFLLPLLFALYTDHAWEDWYITYRASKNLAIGNGLVFVAGQKIHSFTSPLGTLMPAFWNVVTGNSSDDLVLWLYRIEGCALLGLSALLILRIAAANGMAQCAMFLMLGLFAVDARIIDFSINGMETQFMVLFLTLQLYALSVPSKNFALILGIAWGGLMWSRPDSFVYAGGLTFGYLLFMPASLGETSRIALFKKLVIAGIIAAVIYIPWLIWATYYYGTPIPHTIVAKGLHARHNGPLDLLISFVRFPFDMVTGKAFIAYTFMPPYYGFGGWTVALTIVSELIALPIALYWLWPSGRADARAVSFAVFCSHFYLKRVAASVSPWYVPNVTFLSIIALGLIGQQIWDALVRKPEAAAGAPDIWRQRLWLGSIGCVAASTLMTLATAYELRAQQSIIETGHRREIGLWLARNAKSPRDTVLMECLGYIGFFSGLKTYDFPGMSSPEMVEARRRLKTDDYAPLIADLKPDWLVLRPVEIANVAALNPALLVSDYEIAKVFDAGKAIDAYAVLPGRGYLQFDQVFTVYRRK